MKKAMLATAVRGGESKYEFLHKSKERRELIYKR